MKHLRIVENVYRKHVELFVEPDRKKAEKWIGKRLGQEEDLTRVMARTYYPSGDGSGDLLVWLQSTKDITSMSHEFIHAAVYILERVGIPIEVKTDEALAYLHGFLMSSALHAFGLGRFVGSKKSV